jgi:hypothetical protein
MYEKTNLRQEIKGLVTKKKSTDVGQVRSAVFLSRIFSQQ